jgi:uncharacterized membrane protein YcaP (DUF421 family)
LATEYFHDVFLFVLGFRIPGRRQLGQLNVVDLVAIIIMGSAAETAFSRSSSLG